MEADTRQDQGRSTLVAAVCLLVLVGFCYANSLTCSWHYDDFANIVENPRVHVTNWSWDSFKDIFSAGLPHQRVSRPLAYFSFALNYRFGGTHVLGFHVVNLLIHWVAGLVLFLFVRDTLSLPIFENRYGRQGAIIAGIAASLWVTHPIHVTAVTYIVQRMASMAGLFYIMAMWFYLKLRTARNGRQRLLFLPLMAISILCALMTKENTVLVVYSIGLFEALLLVRESTKDRGGRLLAWGLGLTACIVVIGFLYTDPRKLFQSFEIRNFTWLERLISQPRVLFFYLSLLAVPMTSRMSLVHDIEVSRSLWDPWTTAASLAGLLLLMVFLLLQMRRRPLLPFCGLFFLLNHAIESSFLNLEMVYEHRNYIPSMLLFVALSVATVEGASIFKGRHGFQAMIFGLAAFWCVSQIHTTVSYNRVFQSELTLWSDVVVKYPRSSVGHLNLGKVYWEDGLYDEAAASNRRALQFDRFNNHHQKALAHYNLGLYQLEKNHAYGRAKLEFRRAQSEDRNASIWKKIAKTWMQAGEHEIALEYLQDALNRWGRDSELFRMLGLANLKSGNYPQAEAYARQAVEEDADDKLSRMVLAQSLRKQNRIEPAMDILENLIRSDPDNLVSKLALLEIYVEQKQLESAARLIGQLPVSEKLKNSKISEIIARIEIERKHQEMMPYVPDMDLLKKLMAATSRGLGVNRKLR